MKIMCYANYNSIVFVRTWLVKNGRYVHIGSDVLYVTRGKDFSKDYYNILFLFRRTANSRDARTNHSILFITIFYTRVYSIFFLYNCLPTISDVKWRIRFIIYYSAAAIKMVSRGKRQRKYDSTSYDIICDTDRPVVLSSDCFFFPYNNIMK